MASLSDSACDQNISLVPYQYRQEKISATLHIFRGNPAISEPDEKICKTLGQPTPEKCWLAASLAKTIRLQLHPPPEVRAASALADPDWIME